MSQPAHRDQVAEFHRRIGADVRTTPTPAPQGALRRCEFVEEEAAELRAAVCAGDIVQIADALGDLLYVTYGTALHFGIDVDEVFAEIHRSNMTKSPAGNQKAVKGPRYSPPRIEAVLGSQADDEERGRL